MTPQFIRVTPFQRVFVDNDYTWRPQAEIVIGTRYIVSITISSEKFSQIRMRDGSQFIVPTSQTTQIGV